MNNRVLEECLKYPADAPVRKNLDTPDVGKEPDVREPDKGEGISHDLFESVPPQPRGSVVEELIEDPDMNKERLEDLFLFFHEFLDPVRFPILHHFFQDLECDSDTVLCITPEECIELEKLVV